MTESWSDKNGNWYRKYADGWIEQGGYTTGLLNADADLVFPVAFSNKQYTLLAVVGLTSANSQQGGIAQALAVTKSTFRVRVVTDRSWAEPVYWYACGY